LGKPEGGNNDLHPNQDEKFVEEHFTKYSYNRLCFTYITYLTVIVCFSEVCALKYPKDLGVIFVGGLAGLTPPEGPLPLCWDDNEYQ
jgi:hypothetical protein